MSHYVPEIYTNRESTNKIVEVTKPVAAFSRYNTKTIRVVAVPFDTYTVIDCDESSDVVAELVEEAVTDNQLVGVILTERGIQVIFSGRTTAYKKYQDQQYADISAERRAWTMRAFTRDDSKPRHLILVVEDDALRDAWVAAGGLARFAPNLVAR